MDDFGAVAEIVGYQGIALFLVALAVGAVKTFSDYSAQRGWIYYFLISPVLFLTIFLRVLVIVASGFLPDIA